MMRSPLTLHPCFRYGLVSLVTLWAVACGSEGPPAEPQSAAAPTTETADDDAMTILFLGNSLTAGYGLDNPDNAFPALIQHKIDALDWPFRVVNAGLSGETSAGGLRRISWLLRQEVRVFVLELGANDGLRGLPPEAAQTNLQAIMDTVKTRYPNVKTVLAGMEAPPNLGERYTEAFRQIYPDLAEANDAVLIPFLLEDVGGIPTLNQADRIHPNVEGHKIIAETVWAYLRPVLESLH